MKRHLLMITLFCLSFNAQASDPLWSVDDCIHYAMKNNIQLKQQLLEALDTKNELTVRTLSFLPSFSAGTSVSASFGRSIDPETNTYQSVSNLNNSYNLGGSMTIFSGLNLINGYKIAKISVLRQEYMAQQMENQVAIATMNAYYRVIFAHGAHRIAKEELDNSNKHYRKAKIEYKIGLANISEVAQLESRVSQGTYNLTNLEGVYLKAIVDLKNQIDFPLDSTLTVDTLVYADPISIQTDNNFEDVFLSAQKNLPEFKLMESNHRISELQLSSARASFMPSISLGGSIGTSYSKVLEGSKGYNVQSYSDQMENKLGQSVSISMSIPIFSALSKQKYLQRQKHALERIELANREQRGQLQKIIYEAVIDLAINEKKCLQSEDNVSFNTLSYRTVEARYNNGLSTVIDMQTVQTNLSNARMDYLRSFLNYQIQCRIVDYYKGIPLINN